MAAEVVPILAAPHLGLEERARLERQAARVESARNAHGDGLSIRERARIRLGVVETSILNGWLPNTEEGQALCRALADAIPTEPGPSADAAVREALARLRAWCRDHQPPPTSPPRGPRASQMALGAARG